MQIIRHLAIQIIHRHILGNVVHIATPNLTLSQRMVFLVVLRSLTNRIKRFLFFLRKNGKRFLTLRRCSVFYIALRCYNTLNLTIGFFTLHFSLFTSPRVHSLSPVCQHFVCHFLSRSKVNAKHISHALPILCQSLLYFFQESLCLHALSHALAFLRSKLSHHVLKLLRSLASRVGCYHFLIQGVAFQFGVQLLHLFLQTFHLVKELLHAFPFLRVNTAQHVTPQMRILMQRCLWLHLSRVEINLLAVSKAIHLTVLGAELLHAVVYLQASLQRLVYLVRLLHALFRCANLETYLLKLYALSWCQHVLGYLNLSVAHKLLGSLCNLSVRQHSHGFAPTRENYLSCTSSLLVHLATHNATLPVYLTYSVLGSFCLVPAAQFAHRNLAFHDNDVRTNPSRLELVVQRRA